ncbi:unnamed protein product, partial [Pocillopora meandrina]
CRGCFATVQCAAATILFFTVRISVVSATATVGNVRVMNARLRKEKRYQTSSQQPADTSHDDLKKKYESLQKDYKRVGQAFQNQQEQNQELKALLEEREKEAEELANLVRNKDEVVKNLERRHVDAKKVIAELRAETADIRVSTHSLANIHERYDQVLQTMKENKCSMACAFCLAGCPRSTLRDFVAIAELKKVASRELDLVLRDQEVQSVRDLEVACRKRLRRYIPVMNNMRREGQLLPMKFAARFYE